MTDTAINIFRIYTLVFGGVKKRQARDANGKPLKDAKGELVKLDPFKQVTVEVDFASLPESSQTKIIEYGLTQYLGDRAAGAGDDIDFASGIEAQRAKLLSGDFSRKAGEGFGRAETEDSLTRSLLSAWFRDKAKAANKALSAEQAKTLVASALLPESKLAAQAAACRAEAVERIAAKAKLIAAESADGDDIFAALGDA